MRWNPMNQSDEHARRTPQCEYMATADDAGVRGVDGEVVDGDTVYCTAEADVVLRPPGLSAKLGPGGMGKKVVCRAHGQYLRNPKSDDEISEMNTPPRKWEQCGENPEAIANAR